MNRASARTAAPATALTITRPDDWHIHLRDGAALRTTVPHVAAHFGRAIVMPNVRPPITTAALALAYRDRILAARAPAATAFGAAADFEPLMTLYLTDHSSAAEMQAAKAAGIVACKLYPAGATTHSDAGVTAIKHSYPALEAMQRLGLLLLVHGEVTDPAVDVFDREAVFIERVLAPLRRDFPALKIVLEHITTAQAAAYVQAAPSHLAATITPQHLLFNRNALFQGGLRPHFYCLPVLKREAHRLALVQAACSGDVRFFLGTDSAPHAAALKEHAQGCAGCYSTPQALALYAQVFDECQALHRFEAFAAFHGADFYGLPRNRSTVTLLREDQVVPADYPYADARLKPLMAQATLSWRVQD